MAYITAQQVSIFRKQIKALFPDWKISVTTQNHSTVKVSILEATIDLISLYHKAADNNFNGYIQTNRYTFKDDFMEPAASALIQIKDICMFGNYDNSEIQYDYFDVGWYFRLDIGNWDKPFKYIGPDEIRDRKLSKVLKTKKTIVKEDKKDIEIIDYSDKSFVVVGDTYSIKDKLKELRGRYNIFLKDPNTGERITGWIFSIKSKDKVKELLYENAM